MALILAVGAAERHLSDPPPEADPCPNLKTVAAATLDPKSRRGRLICSTMAQL
jgi:hypothetical protein